MESLAEQSGDVEQLVAVLERDLTCVRQYERIASAYREAGKHEKALHWAERGMALYPGREGVALRRFVAEEYRRQERHADALRILWTDFRAEPSVHAYEVLEDFARAADDWDDWRERAIAHIRRTLTTHLSGPEPALQRWLPVRGHSLLVEVFLHERNIDAAWREAQAGGCSDALWLQLAAQREQDQPADAASVYLRLGEESVSRTSDGRYEHGIGLLERAAALMHRLNRSAEFQRCFEAIRQRLKNKRNLQKLAEARRNALYL
jgi:tetratricopeptide (TPR) repeat protein